MKDSRLKPCPFCGGEFEIQVTDDEGNFHDEDYIKNPWSGLWYEILHDVDKYPECLISRYSDESLGHIAANSVDYLVKQWNKRSKRTKI